MSLYEMLPSGCLPDYSHVPTQICISVCVVMYSSLEHPES